MFIPITTTARPARHLARFGLARCDIVPGALLVFMAALALIWNLKVGIVWQRPWLPALPLALLAIAFASGGSRKMRIFAETALYSGLWMAVMVYGIQLTYLANALGLPLRDHALESADLFLGFNWLAWTQFVNAHRWLMVLQWTVYESNVTQPFLCAAIFALLRRRERNAELLTAIMIALLLTIVLSALVPSVGPGVTYSTNPPWVPIIEALRSGRIPPLPYEGIVTFPSFHTAMAILFVYANRGLRPSFGPFLALNALMLIAVPYCGQHYLVDLLGGAAAAGLAIVATRRVV